MRCGDDNDRGLVLISPDGIKLCTRLETHHYDSSEMIFDDQSPQSHGISVVDLNGDTRAILPHELVDTCKVMTIQRQIFAQTGIMEEQLRLVHCGRVLRPTEMLTDHSSITLFVKSIKVRQLFRFKRFF